MILLEFTQVTQSVEGLLLISPGDRVFYGNWLILIATLHNIIDYCTAFFLHFFDRIIDWIGYCKTSNRLNRVSIFDYLIDFYI